MRLDRVRAVHEQVVNHSSPLLEQADPLTPAVGAPQVAPAGTVVAAVVRAVIAGSAPANAGPPVDLDQ